MSNPGSPYAGLQSFIEAGDRDAIERICTGDAVNTVFADGETPLHIVAARHPTELVRKILAAGGNPNASGWDGVTPLHRAARSDYSESVAALLDAGADPTTRRSTTKETPEEISIRLGKSEHVLEFRKRSKAN